MAALTLFDVGNTHTRIAVCDAAGGLYIVRVIPTAELGRGDVPDGKIAVCSVVPEKLPVFVALPDVFVLEAPRYRGDLVRIRADAATLGSDRLANAIALASCFPLPAVSVDCGTAVTLEFVDRSRNFIGGAILPGRKLQRQALAGGTAQLGEYPLADSRPAASGGSTAAAIAAGVDLGSVGAVSTIIESCEKERLGCKCSSCVFTGGDADFFAGIYGCGAIEDEMLTLKGLMLAWRESCV